ncbi:cell division protein FtsA [Pelagibius sp. CAU 1746]|uniref:cell division protein FtsA n=1 Tax=Pelagibius sp. CAU 1746 TaxID=3140370 RepID=UPI00325AEA5A
MRKGLVRGGIAAALDVGSSKVCCFIARVDDDGRPQVIGIGQQASRGIKSGAIVDMDLAETSVLNAVHAAEQMAGTTIDRVVVNLSGGYPASSTVGVEVSLNGHEVGEADLRRAVAYGHQTQLQRQHEDQSRQMIHSIPTGYSIDGNRGIRDPRGMFGEQLGVHMHIITASAGAVRNVSTCIQRCHLEPAAFVVSPYASGLACLVEDETELGVTVIDMGGGTTTIAVFYENNVIFTDVIPVGGNHVTSDIARGLSTPLVHSERMKTLYGHVIAAPTDERELIDVPQVGEDENSGSQQIPRSLLVGIIQPRVEETLELVRSRLELSGFDKIAGRRVVLTGGACQLPGTRELASTVLDKQVRIGRPTHVGGLAEATAGPAYATCAGLLNYAATADVAMPGEASPEPRELSGLMGRLGHWLREHF